MNRLHLLLALLPLGLAACQDGATFTSTSPSNSMGSTSQAARSGGSLQGAAGATAATNTTTGMAAPR